MTAAPAGQSTKKHKVLHVQAELFSLFVFCLFCVCVCAIELNLPIFSHCLCRYPQLIFLWALLIISRIALKDNSANLF